MSPVFKDQVNGFDNDKLENLDIILIYRDPSSYKELPNKKYVADSPGEYTIFGFN